MYITDHKEKSSNYYDAIYASGYNTRRYYPLYQFVLELIQKTDSPSVLEIGCGVGDLGKLIVESSIPYRGFDFSEEAVRCARRLCPEADFSVGDAYAPEAFAPSDYSVAVALEVLEHVDDLKVLTNLPTGVRLIASVPDYDDDAHLRIYENPQRDIIERFRPFLEVDEVVPLVYTQQTTGRRMTIYIFHGLRTAGNSNQAVSDAVASTAAERG
jgi:trans-aconitate methyltransferase